MRVAGLDGCKSGWVVVVLDEGAVAEVRLVGSLDASAFAGVSVVGIDMPIGLAEDGVRAADALARKFIAPLGSSVFSTPPRAALGAASYASALELSRAAGGRGISKQSYFLIPKIREVEAFVRRASVRIVECHPEVCFTAMAGAPPSSRKKTWNGAMIRRRLLAERGIVLEDALGDAGEAPIDDVLDAAAVAWSAMRVARGEAKSMPDPPERDATGIEMAIWY